MKLSVYVFDDDCAAAQRQFDELVESMPEEVEAKETENRNKREFRILNLAGDADEIAVTFSRAVNETDVRKEIASIREFGDLILIDDHYRDVASMFGQRVILPTLVDSIKSTLRLLPVCCLWTRHWKNDVSRRETFAAYLDKTKSAERVIIGMEKDNPRRLIEAIRWTAILKRLALMEADLAATARVAGLCVKKDAPRYGNIVGESAAMATVFELIAKYARSDEPVIIFGASGTGKENVAQNIHNASPRKEEKFLAIDAGTISSELGAPELFGYVKGAFTGATASTPGLLEAVGKGTLFIDEIGNLSIDVQKKLLRVLQEREFSPIGDRAKPRKFHGRIISATNADLELMNANGTFRSDLYHRIGVLDIHLPTLAERGKEEIVLLVKHFLSKLSGENKALSVNDAAMEALCRYHWPGNVRELRNKIAKAITVAGEACVLTLTEFPGLTADDQQRVANVLRSGGTAADSNDGTGHEGNSSGNFPPPLPTSADKGEIENKIRQVEEFVRSGQYTRPATLVDVGRFLCKKDGSGNPKSFGMHLANHANSYAYVLVEHKGHVSEEALEILMRCAGIKREYMKQSATK